MPSSVSDDVVDQRILEQSMRLPEGGGVTGWAACRLRRAAYFDGLERDGSTRQPVPLLVPPESKVRSLNGSTVSREPFGPGERGASAAELVSIREMAGYVAEHSTWRRARRVSWALTLASERSLSPGETRMRLVWMLDAGLGMPLVNQHVWDRRGKLLGIADILGPGAGVVGEYDGATHRRAGRHTSDVRREDLFRRATCSGPRVTPSELFCGDHASWG